MKGIKLLALISVLCLFIAVAPVCAGDNDTAISDEAVMSDYYFDVSVLNDTGDGSLENPYKELKSDRIVENTTLHFADGEYELNHNVNINNLTIVGSGAEKTVINYQGVGFNTESSIVLSNITFNFLGLDSHGLFKASNVIFKDYSRSTKSLITFSKGNMTFTNCTFSNIYSGIYGGALNVKSCDVNITDCTFTNSGVKLYGGAIYASGSNITVLNSKFSDDYASNDAGGAVYLVDSEFRGHNLEFVNCSARFGGAVCSLSGELNINGSIFKNNRAKYGGGAVYKMYRSFTLANSTFYNNSASEGGAVYSNIVEDFKINSNYFISNNAKSSGGSLYSLLSETYYPVGDKALNNTFIRNSAPDIFQSDKINLTLTDSDYCLLNYSSDLNEILPSRYDLRDYGWVSSVKEQGKGGNCWAFSALAALESAILKATGIEYDFSEENMKNLMSLYSPYGWGMDTNNGGYDKMALGYLAGWLGPVNESDDVYNDKSLLSPFLESIFHVQNVLFLTRSDFTDNDAIKKAVLNYGAVSTSMYWGSAYGKNYYYNDVNGANHAVAIVGWDDNYSASNFKSKPKGDGAWIIKNSWGDNQGEKGFYYVSYYDTKFAQVGKTVSYVFVLNDTVRYDKNYQYDIQGRTDNFINSTKTVWYKNRFTATGNEYLSAVSTYFEKKSQWDLSVYVNGILKTSQSGESPASYSTINLNSMIPLKIGDVFEIVFKVTVDYNASVPISEAVSLNAETYSYNISFISYDGKNWADLYNLEWAFPEHTYVSQVACIKAFTVFDKIKTKIVLNVSDEYNPANITAKVFNEYGGSVNSGKVTFTLEGKKHVVDVKNGIASIVYQFSALKDNLILASYSGVGYEESSARVTANVVQVYIDADDLNVYCGDIDYAVSLRDANNNPVSGKSVDVKINDKTYSSISDAKGIASFSFRLGAGIFVAEIGFTGENVNLTKKITAKSTVTLPSASKYTFNAKYRVTLIDSNGNAVKNTEVPVSVGGIECTVSTDNNGKLNFNIDLNPGSHTLTVTNPSTGEKKSQKITVAARIAQNKDLTMYYGAGSSYKVRVYDDNGNVAKNMEVILTINGKHYSRYSDSNGYVYLKINLAPKTYTIEAKCNGFSVKNKIVVKTTLITKNMAVKKSKTFKYSVKLLNSKGKILKYKKITVKFKGKTYKVKTNKKGIAVFKIKVNSKLGKFTITTSYGKLKMTNKITVKK